jgi:hypothetical protein
MGVRDQEEERVGCMRRNPPSGLESADGNVNFPAEEHKRKPEHLFDPFIVVGATRSG